MQEDVSLVHFKHDGALQTNTGGLSDTSWIARGPYGGVPAPPQTAPAVVTLVEPPAIHTACRGTRPSVCHHWTVQCRHPHYVYFKSRNFLLLLLEAWSCYVVQLGLALTVRPGPAPNSWQSFQISLPSAGFTGVHHDACLKVLFLIWLNQSCASSFCAFF